MNPLVGGLVTPLQREEAAYRHISYADGELDFVS